MVWGRVQPLRVELAVHFLQIFLRSLLFGAVGGRTLSSCSALMYLPARQWGGGDVRRVFCCVCEQFVVFYTTVDQSSTGEQTSQLLSTAQNRRHSYEWPLEADAEKGLRCESVFSSNKKRFLFLGSNVLAQFWKHCFFEFPCFPCFRVFLSHTLF